MELKKKTSKKKTAQPKAARFLEESRAIPHFALSGDLTTQLHVVRNNIASEVLKRCTQSQSINTHQPVQPLSSRLGELAVHRQHVEVTPEGTDVDGDSLQRPGPAVLRPKVYRASRHTLRDRALSRSNPDENGELAREREYKVRCEGRNARAKMGTGQDGDMT